MTAVSIVGGETAGRRSKLQTFIIWARVCICAGLAVPSGLLIGWDSKFNSSPALVWLHGLASPWWAWGIAFFASGLFITIPKTRPLGYLIGFVLYGMCALAVLHAVPGQPHNNIAAINGLIAFALLHGLGIITATKDRGGDG